MQDVSTERGKSKELQLQKESEEKWSWLQFHFSECAQKVLEANAIQMLYKSLQYYWSLKWARLGELKLKSMK